MKKISWIFIQETMHRYRWNENLNSGDVISTRCNVRADYQILIQLSNDVQSGKRSAYVCVELRAF